MRSAGSGQRTFPSRHGGLFVSFPQVSVHGSSMRIALLTGDSRGFFVDSRRAVPEFGTAPEALLQGFALMPEVEVHVVSCARSKMNSPAKLAPNIFFHSLYVPKLGWLSTGYQGCIRAIRKTLKEIQPEIVHGQGTERECALSAAFSGFANVVTIHGNMGELARQFRARLGSYGWLAAKLENLALKRTAGGFCNSTYTEELVKPRTRRTWCVPNAIREGFFAPTEKPPGNRRCILLNVGLISPRKRQLEVLDVARALRRQGLDFEIQFVGTADPMSPYAAAFLEKVRGMKAEGCARYVGQKAAGELVEVMNASSAMVHFPFEESFGLVVAEGLARELKLFGTRVGGIREIAAGVPDAELFEPDDWRGLGSAIAGWIGRGFPRAHGAGEVMRIRYHPEIIARRHIEIYREVLGRQAAAAK
jgi:glycosyltransferase involved in cell wall biosynthesis